MALLFRAIIEVLGKPKEHVQESMQLYMQNLRQDSRFKLVQEEIAALEEQKDELWSTFVELEIKTTKIDDLIFFCFQYMPSSIEIVEPAQFNLSDADLNSFLGDLQSRLHSVDMLAKQAKLENDALKNNMGALLKNYIIVLLSQNPRSSEQLSKLTGVTKDTLEDFLDQLIDSQEVALKNDTYSVVPKSQSNN